MRRALILTFLGAALVATACPVERPDEGACERACEVATRCGVLPSLLGGRPGDATADLVDGCVFRCLNSDTAGTETPEDEKQVQRILGCLQPRSDGGTCDIDTCVDVVECLQEVVPPGALGEPQVTFQLIDGEYWTLFFEAHVCADIPPETLSLDPEEVAALCRGDGDICPLPGAATELPLRPPLCVGDRCIDDDTCDPRLCGFDLSAAFDCAFLGIESVQFGWLDERNLLHLDPATYTCEQASAGQIVPGVGHQVIYPLALFNGKMSARVLDYLDAPFTAEGRPYCWLSHPVFPPDPPPADSPGFAPVGWLVRSGPNVIAVPSPISGTFAALVADDPNLFPRGCGCLLDDAGCEDNAANSNCANGIDDDRDGLLDAEDPGCEQP